MARHLAIGDIHGCISALTTLVDFVALRDDDIIVTLGDYIDRGPDSRAVLDFLIEDAEFVTYPVANGWNFESGQGIEKTGGEATQAPVSQARLFLLHQELIQIQPEVVHGLANFLIDPQFDEVISQMGSEEELGGEIAHGPTSLHEIGQAGFNPSIEHAIPDRVGQGHVIVVGRGHHGKSTLDVEQIIDESSFERLNTHAGADSFPAADFFALFGLHAHPRDRVL